VRQQGGQVAVQQLVGVGGLGPVEVDQPHPPVPVDHHAGQSQVTVGDPGRLEGGDLLPDAGQPGLIQPLAVQVSQVAAGQALLDQQVGAIAKDRTASTAGAWTPAVAASSPRSTRTKTVS
jgi:hypothetical protein